MDKKNVKTVFTYLEIHILLSLTVRKIQGQKAHPQDLQEEKTIYFSSDSAT